jgi:hypothetical protein
MKKYKIKLQPQITGKGMSQSMLLLGILLMIFELGCKKIVQVDAPYTSLTGKNVYTNNTTSISVLTGIYTQMGNGDIYSGVNGISLNSGLAADELTLWKGGMDGGDLQRIYQNNLSSQVFSAPYYWVSCYRQLLTANSALEGLTASNTLTPRRKKAIAGRSLFYAGVFSFLPG